MASAHDELERFAQRAVESIRPRAEATPSSLLEFQIAFWFEELGRARDVQREQLRRILQNECYVDTDLMALDVYAPAKIWHYRGFARESLKTKLLRLDEERRRLIAIYEQESRGLRARLLELICQRALLEG